MRRLLRRFVCRFRGHDFGTGFLCVRCDRGITKQFEEDLKDLVDQHQRHLEKKFFENVP